jgi:hypothetical protein
MNNASIKTLLTILPVLTAGLYLIGGTYHQSYLESFGIEDSMFFLPIDRLLFLGFYALLSISMKPYMYGVLLALLLFAAILIVVMLSLNKKIYGWQSLILRNFKKSSEKKTPIRAAPALQAVLDKSDQLGTWLLSSFSIFVILLLIIMLSRGLGQGQALDEMKDFSAAKGGFVILTADQLTGDSRAKQIICGTTYCAYWLGTTTVILKHEQIKKIVIQPPPSKQ